MGIEHRQNLNQVANDAKNGEVRKSLHRAQASIPMNDGKLLGLRFEPHGRVLNFGKKLQPQSLAFPFLPISRIW